jgi:hypothetical protein
MESSMKGFNLRAVAVTLTLSIGAGSLSACASQQSSSGQASDLPATRSASAYQSSYAYDPRSASGVMDLSKLDPLAAGLENNQTIGFGADQRLVFTYQQQFDCVVQPNDDRNFSGKPADLDPQQFASPECQIDAPSTIDPTGLSVKQTDPLYILVPFFETNKKTPAFTKTLGAALKKLFGFVPDAFKPSPGVPVQCPAPKDKPATCTMHPLQTDLGPLLTALGLLPKDTNLYVPLVNHDHLLTDKTINQGQEWWQIIVVLVKDPKAWPNAQGTTGITSIARLRAAQSKKQASEDVPSNFFLFFSSKAMGNGVARMPGMHM